MANQEFFTTVKYRKNSKLFSLDYFMHRGRKSIAEVHPNSVEIIDTTNEQALASIKLAEILGFEVKHGMICIRTASGSHVLDFAAPFHEGLMKKISAKDRALELAGHLKAAGVNEK